MSSSQKTGIQLKIKTVVKCKKCGSETVRDFKQGDYVMKVEGQCSKDGGELYIAGIYGEGDTKEKR